MVEKFHGMKNPWCIPGIASGIILLALLLAGSASAATLTVNTSGGAMYLKIQDAIDNATAGDTIEVYSGTYFENVNVNKQLTLRGLGMPVVDAKGSGSAITLAADGIRLEGFSVRGGSSAGIRVNSKNNTVIGNNASNNVYYGIYLESSSNNKIYNNIFNNTNNLLIENSNINTWNTTLQSSPNIINGSHLGGNFWANPAGTGFSQTCADGNRDGICDSSYVIDNNNIDYLPLAFVTAIPILNISANRTTVTAGTPVNVTFTVTSNGTPISGASVTLSGNASGNSTTDANGRQ